MIFTTTKKKIEKEEMFPDKAVMTLHKLSEERGSKTVFELNSSAMKMLGFPMNTPNVSKIAHGYDESNVLVLATMDTDDVYTSNVTAKNTFGNQKLFERLARQFNVDGFSNEYFELKVEHVDQGGTIYTSMSRINPVLISEVQEESQEEAEDLLQSPGEMEALPIVPTNQNELIGVNGW
jgi:hypothetical protein